MCDETYYDHTSILLKLSFLKDELTTGAFERDNDAAGITLTDAFGADVLTVRQGDMDDATLVGRHGLKGDGAAIIAHLLRHAQGQGAQVLFAALAIVLGINDDTHAVAGAVADDQVDQQLQRGQRLAAPPDQQAQILIDAVNIERERVRRAHLHGGMDIHIAQDMLQDIDGDLDIFAARHGHFLHAFALALGAGCRERLFLQFRRKGSKGSRIEERSRCFLLILVLFHFQILFVLTLLVEFLTFFIEEFLVLEFAFFLVLVLVLLHFQVFVLEAIGAEDGVGHFGGNDGAGASDRCADGRGRSRRGGGAHDIRAHSDAHASLFAPQAKCAASGFLQDGDLHFIAASSQARQGLLYGLFNRFATGLYAFQVCLPPSYSFRRNCSLETAFCPLQLMLAARRISSGSLTSARGRALRCAAACRRCATGG